MKKTITFLIMLILLITVFCAKHISAQGLWAENSKTSQRHFLVVGQRISYKLNSSTNFQKGRIAGFNDSTLSVKIEDRQVTMNFRSLSAIKIPRGTGRTVAGVYFVGAGAISLIIAMGANQPLPPPSPQASSSKSYSGLGPRLTAIDFGVSATVVAGVITIPIGIALSTGKTMNLKQDWTLKTK